MKQMDKRILPIFTKAQSKLYTLSMHKTIRLILSIFALLMLKESAEAQCCSYYLSMSDSYGDGWNGGTLELLIDGESQGLYFAQGFVSGEAFEVCEGQTIELVYSAGDWENENSYQWVDVSGIAIFSDGPDPAVGTVYTGEVDCTISVLPGEVPCSALPLDSTACLNADNTGLTTSGFSPNCANYQGQDIWFQIEVPPSGNLSVNTANNGGMNDTGLAIWQSTTCTGLNLIACDDDGASDYFSFVSLFNLNPGDILYAQVWAYGGGSGSFEICMQDLGTVVLEASELPIVDIHTNGQAIPDEPKVDVMMRLIYNGPGNLSHVTDSANVYYGHIGIEIRGASSAGYPQKPYGFETRDAIGNNNNVSLLGMPEENDWVFLSNYNDKSFVRNLLAHHLFNEMGHYAPRMTLCEMLIDSTYQGIYLIGENIKRDDGRVAIATLDSSENVGDDVTGGYIFKSDLAYGNNYWTSNYSPIDHPDFDIRFVYHYPKEDEITVDQKSYLSAFLDSMETAMYSPGFDDPETGYRRFMEDSSFMDYFLINELSRNNDGFKKSRYYHKDKFSNGGKLKAGPTWDFDWAWKNISSCDLFSQTDGSGWAHLVNDCPTDNYSPGWYLRLLQDSTFANALYCRYTELRSTILDISYLHNYIDSVASLVSNAQARHYQKWPTLGLNVGTPEVGPIPNSFQGEVDYLKSWIALRLDWLDENMPGQCIDSPTGLTPHDRPPLYFYPNPSDGPVVIKGPLSGTQIAFYDGIGRAIDVIQLDEGPGPWQYSFPVKGLILYHIFLNGEVLGTGRLLVE